ncbi:unnamed protein product [Rotaria sp. Silwood2]|nr:unnamed protein product [Rotaria sp. Silwood2]CAF4611433.1 unnamed protein product [Rotaria sp. Silwood2]
MQTFFVLSFILIIAILHGSYGAPSSFEDLRHEVNAAIQQKALEERVIPLIIGLVANPLWINAVLQLGAGIGGAIATATGR